MKTSVFSTRQRGFSLVELSIVLVILGLLVGGVLSGQSLIRAAELRSVSTEYARFNTAIGTFRDKYFALPGDMNNAVSFWTADAACPSVVASATTNVCNGDGDGNIVATSTNSNEVFGFWEHLARAGLVEGSYNGAPNSATATATVSNPGVNVPRAKLTNASWDIAALGTAGVVNVSSTTYFDGSFGNVFLFGGGTSALVPTGVLKPEEAWNIDTKLDDGRPAIGSVVSLESQGSGVCSDLAPDNATTRAAAVYSLSVTTSTACSLLFKSGY
jgi:prepilin-type N-terminal cleavage/methylation domain-containing protein